MFDVYLSDRRDLLVVRKGFPIPLSDASGRWRKSKKRVVSVSDEIRSAVQKPSTPRKLKKRQLPDDARRIAIFAETQPLS